MDHPAQTALIEEWARVSAELEETCGTTDKDEFLSDIGLTVSMERKHARIVNGYDWSDPTPRYTRTERAVRDLLDLD